MKCQLEMNVNYYDPMIGLSNIFTVQEFTSSPTVSIISSLNSGKMRISKAMNNMKRTNLQTLISVEDSNQHEQSVLLVLPHQWSIDDSTQSDQIDSTYSIVDQTDRDRKAQIRMYSTVTDKSSRLRLKRHQLALEKLSGKFEREKKYFE